MNSAVSTVIFTIKYVVNILLNILNPHLCIHFPIITVFPMKATHTYLYRDISTSSISFINNKSLSKVAVQLNGTSLSE